jgi:hypothetical protein
MRLDLLALTADDLAALTTRGDFNRARREVDGGEISGDIAEDAAGNVSVTWSDGPACTVPAGVALRDGRCSCASVKLCRHLVRTVLAYQKSHAVSPEVDPGPLSEAGPWNPGDIGDEALAKVFRPALLTKLKTQFEAGVVAELSCGAKPVARLHHPLATVRFLVPGDVRYAECDCADPAPCPHVPLAVWAFRRLDPSQSAGLVSTAGKAAALPADLFAEIDGVVHSLLETGFSGATVPWADRLRRLETSCRTASLTWPADVLEDLGEQFQRYATHDAAFAPDRAAELVGELLLRRDAIERDTGALPQALVRGTGVSAAGKLAKTRFIGLGLRAVVRHRETEVIAYMQDVDTGGVSVASKERANPVAVTGEPPPAPPNFARLAGMAAFKSLPLREMARGQLLIEGGQRTAAGRLKVSQANASVQPQNFTWETLRSPVLVEDFATLRARLAALPPSCLRPRRAGEDFFVLPVAVVASAGFDHATQTTVAELRDATGNAARLVHPYADGNAGGTEALLDALTRSVKFVSGVIRVAAGGLVVEPCAVIVEESGVRRAVLPWGDAAPTGRPAAGITPGDTGHSAEPLTAAFEALSLATEELIVVGLRRADTNAERRWRELQHRADSLGLARVGTLLAAVADGLAGKRASTAWDADATADAFARVVALLRLSRDA